MVLSWLIVCVCARARADTQHSIRCDVMTNEISRIEVVTRTKHLYIDDPFEVLSLLAFDSQGVCGCVYACMYVCMYVCLSVCSIDVVCTKIESCIMNKIIIFVIL